MTLLEKIKNYKWFDSPNKLRAINTNSTTSNFGNHIGNIA